MSLRTKALLIGGMTATGLVVLLYLAAQIILTDGFAKAEDQEVLENSKRAKNAVALQLSQLHETGRDWAFWDDVYAFVDTGDPEFIRSNLNAETFDNLRLNIIVFVDTSGKIVYGRAYDLITQQSSPLPSSLTQHLTLDKPLGAPPTLTKTVNGIVMVPEGPLLIDALPILTSQIQGPPRGTLIFGRYLNSSVLASISDATEIDITLNSWDAPTSSPQTRQAQALLSEQVSSVSLPIDEERIAGYVRLLDIYKQPALILQINSYRDIYQQGQKSLLYLLGSLVAIGCAFLGTAWFFLERLFLARVFSLSENVQRIGVEPAEFARVPVTGQDELSKLANAINKMLDAIDQSRKALAQSEQKFSKAFNASPDLLTITRWQDGALLEVNDAWERLTGYTRTEAFEQFRTVESFYADPTDRQRILHQVATQGHVQEYPTAFRNKQGEVHPASVSIRPLEINGEKYLLSILRDLTERKLAEETLRAKEEQYRVIIQTTLDGFWILDADGRILDVNDAFCQMIGYNRAELLTLSISDLDMLESPTETAKHLQAIRKGQAHLFETRQRRKDGTLMDVEVNATWLPERERVYAFLRDVSERKRAETLLRESEANLQKSQQIAHIGHWVLDLRAHRITYSDEMYRIFGVELDPRPSHFSRIIFQATHPDDRGKLNLAYQAVSEGKPHEALDYRIVWSDGSVRTVWAIPGESTLDENGKLVKLSGTVQDITERKQVEEALREADRRFRETLENIHLLAVTLDVAGHITFCNEYLLQLTGWKSEEVLGKEWFKLFILPQDQTTLRQIFAQTIQADALPGHYENAIQTREGQILWVSWNNTVLRDPTGTVIGSASIGEDITERKNAEAERERLLGQLMSARTQLTELSHRLVQVEDVERKGLARELHDRVGQNLTVLGINLNIVRAQLPKRSHETLAKVDDSLKLVQETMKHVRDVMADLRPAVLDDYGLVAALRWHAEQFSQRTGISVTLQAAETSQRLESAVEIAFFRIAQEALNNVAKHAQANQATVALEFAPAQVCLIITDPGIGFEPTARVEPGWGLVTMRERAEAIGGTLQITTVPGQGTRIAVQMSLGV